VSETILLGGDLNVVARVGDTVRRPTGPWSAAMHALLRHLEAAGFEGAPRVLGVDEQSREILSYVEGDAAFAPVPASDEVLVDLGRLLRRMHNAQRDFTPPRDAAWQLFPGEPRSGECVCHNDLYWTNLVFRDGRLVALIDGLDAKQRARLVDALLARQRLGYDAHRVWGGVERRAGWAEMWDSGSGNRLLANMHWVDQHRRQIESWLR
jgi:Ser/Thr protein kinase RdoA (MazF antagonist)